MCDTSNLLFFLSAEERRAFLKWLWGLVIIIIIINDIYKAQASPNAAVAPKSVVAYTEKH